MANSVENRVVKMEFDNAAFEKKIASTLKHLGDLDKALQMKGAHKGFADISSAANSVNLNPLSQSVSSLGAGFTAMSTIAITALATVTHATIKAGAQLAKSITFEPIMDGFREFELNMGSIQTILANTKADNTNLQQVNDALDQLNTYSDKTIYNFGQMTRNIGTFTAAGVDLETSVQSIKGISNLAAISGSTAEQASTAMYQLSQAVSTGTLRLMDWNSVVNAGMGGEVFQKALFETGKAMGTIAGVDMGTTFEEWTSAGNSFRDSLQDGWLTGEVLTNTLKGFTGEMTEAQLLAIGYSKEQAAQILELGQTGVEAATKVRTLSQLINTVKESIASGWSESFRTVIGDFEESTDLFTKINENISGFISRSAEARNELLQGWSDLGGRDLLINTLGKAFSNLGKVLAPIGRAFREVFPPMTAERLFDITKSFSNLVDSLTPSQKTIENIGRVAKAFFSVLSIGWEVVKEGVSFIKDLVVQITGLGNGNLLEFTADISDFFTRLREGLVTGGGISDFFDRLRDAAQGPIEFIHKLRDAIVEFFGGFDIGAADAVGNAADRVGERFGFLSTVFEGLSRLSEPLKAAFESIMDILDSLGEVISEWFGELGSKLAEAMGPGDFDAVLDALNVSLLGGIAVILAKFLSGGINLDFGGGFFSGVTDTLEELTGVLSAMQTNIKAEALLKIAGAMAILTASVVALSLIDSAALTKAMTAMAVGFGQLMGAFAILNSMSTLTGGAKITVIATGLVILSIAIGLLAISVAALSRLGWEELAKGLGAVTIMLAALSASAVVLSKNAGSMASAGFSMIGMAIALNLLAQAVKSFSDMSWEEMAKGMVGVAAGLLLMTIAMRNMPATGMASQGLGFLLIAAGLNVLAQAVKSFADMDMGEMAKGLLGLAASLLIVGIAVNAMPPHMFVMGAGLIAVGIALNIIAKALQSFGGMSWSEIGKGLVALGGSLLIIALAVNAMSGALAGAAAMLVVSASLAVLAKVLIEIAKVPFGDLVKAIGAIGLALLVFGGAALALSGVVPAMLGLGAAMLLLGAAFALFGVGAYAVAKALETLAKVGPEAADAIVSAIKAIGRAIPALAQGLAEGLIEFVQTIADAAPVLAKALGVLLVHLLETIEDIIPAVGDVILVLIETILEVIQEAYPQLIETGIGMIMALLGGIRENIGEIVTLVVDIIAEFINAIADNYQTILTAGLNLLVTFINGIGQNVSVLTTAVTNLIITFVNTVAANAQALIDAGFKVLTDFLSGIGNNLVNVVNTVGTVVTEFINAVANKATDIANSGTTALVKFLSGMTNNLVKITTAVGTLITTFVNAVSNNASRVVSAGANSIIRFVTGLGQHAGRIVTAGVTVVINFIQGIANNAIRLARAAADILISFLNSLAAVIEEKSPELRAAGARVAGAIVDGMTGGLAGRAGDVAGAINGIVSTPLNAAKSLLGINSPSTVFMDIGKNVVEGFAIGLSRIAPISHAADKLGDRSVSKLKNVLSRIAENVEFVEDVNPIITPVLDLTRVEADASRIADYISGVDNMVSLSSYKNAQIIASTARPIAESADQTAAASGGVNFEQNIYAPKQLSTSEIYRQTRNQITLAKEELNVA
jgi:tape measure domain-containing protein